MQSGNTSSHRYSLDNVVLPSIPAHSNVEIQVVLNGARVNDVGIATTRGAALTSGLSIGPVRVSAPNVGQIQISNVTTLAIDAPDTQDFVIHLFRATGANAP